ncbi:hypothetical protein MO973_18070 [Paenibacillus sp. TRM 82003]|uniref:hypothetical protein n=1 Tax=Kineococcus sp. TRM81007 TaxID=2925831 RepID=UPI001F57DE6A|nr:hypothetical protein [Kineococcus sp. TRM81007]MCI2238351.1 hypothetical protein [Kineococcus sp. TRM81007]MCI3922137.1 hypothetical protein [Paenibacillus sp. TRM 82003]
MTDDELLAELERRLRQDVDPDVTYDEAVFTLHRWDAEPQDPPLRLHATAEQLGRYCRVDEGTRDALWPDAPVEVAGLNLLQVHLDEALWRALDTAPERRHVVLEPRLAVLTDPAVIDESPPPLPPLPDLPSGEYRWFAYAPLSGEGFPARQRPTEPGAPEV